jgi:predicted MFS family arabinose efflux permease
MAIRLPNIKKANKKENFRQSFNEGLQYTFRFMPLRTLIIHLAILSLVGLSFIVLLPAYAKEILGGGADTLGFLMSALGAGALTGALYMAGRNSALGLSKIISGFTFLLGFAILLAAFSKNVYLSMVLFYFGGLAMILTIASINTQIQTITDDSKRGRVMSFYSMALMGTSPIGNLIAGSIASKIGIPVSLIISGLVTIMAGWWFLSQRNAFRIQVRPVYVEKGLV